MLEILRQLWKKNEGKSVLHNSASAYADDATVLVVKRKVWISGPIYIDDSPFERFASSDLSSIQRFLVEILTSPIKKESGEIAGLTTKEFSRRLGVRSLRQAVAKFKMVPVQLIDDSLVASPSIRDHKTKSWSETEKRIVEKGWREESLGARAVLDELRLSE